MNRYSYDGEPFGLKEYIALMQMYESNSGELLRIPNEYAWVTTTHFGTPYYSDSNKKWILAKHKRTGKLVHLYFRDAYLFDRNGKAVWKDFKVNGQSAKENDYEPYCFPSKMENLAKNFLRSKDINVKRFIW